MLRFKAGLFILFSLFFIGLPAYAEQNPAATGYFKLKMISGRWYFITPENTPFFSIGISGASAEDKDYKLGARHYNALVSRSEKIWALETLNFLTNLGFNSIGAWSSQEFTHNIPYFIIIEYKKTEKNKLVDIFGPDFENMINRIVKDTCSKIAGDHNLIGYFLGNDLNWYGDYSFYMGHESYLFDLYFDLAAHSAGKERVIEFLKTRYGTIEAFNKDWNLSEPDFNAISGLKMSQFNIHNINAIRKEFLKIAAERYYTVMIKSIRTFDNNHLIISDRFANSVPEETLAIAGKYCDVISINYYKNLPDIDRGFLAAIYNFTRKPVLISEFTFRSMDNTSGLRNRVGPDTTVPSQEERALHFKKYAMSFAGLPFIVGYHWFQFYDDPQDGRASDDEDSNYGIVDQLGRPYQPLIDAMRKTNPLVGAIHKACIITIPARNIFLTPRIIVRKGVNNPAFSAVYLDKNTLRNNITDTWGDSVNDGRMTAGKTSSFLLLHFDTGYGWGCGISVFSPVHQSYGYYDASGYKGIKIHAKIPSNLRFFIYLNESGVREPWKKNYPGANGADGESYSSDEAFGTGKTADYYFNFDSFNLRPVWGNQAGNNIMDLQALNDIEIAIPGSQYSGTIELSSIELY